MEFQQPASKTRFVVRTMSHKLQMRSGPTAHYIVYRLVQKILYTTDFRLEGTSKRMR